MNPLGNLAHAQAMVADSYQLLSRVMVAVEQRMQSESFTAVGDSSVFMDASTSLERGTRWLPKHLSRA